MYKPARTVLWADGSRWLPLTRLALEPTAILSMRRKKGPFFSSYLRFSRLNSRHWAENEMAMSKSLLFKLLRIGAIPKKLRPILDAELIVVGDEGMSGSLIYRNVKGPGKRFINRDEGFSGCLVITKKRIVCFTYGKRQINIAVDDQRLSEMSVEIPQKNVLSISFESSAFMEKWEGIMEFRFKTEKANEFYNVLRSFGAQQGFCSGAQKARAR